MNITLADVGVISAVLVALGGLNGLIVRAIINQRLIEFLVQLNGTYTRSGGSGVTGHEIETRLEALEVRRVS